MEKEPVRVPPGEGAKTLRLFGEGLTKKVPSHMTGGAYALFEVATPPGAGPPPHVHHREAEALYVLEGEYVFLVGGRTLRAGTGSHLHVPKGTLHAHENVGVGRMLLIQTPGGLYELFFEEVAKTADGDGAAAPAFEDRPDARRRIVEVASEYGIEIPPPNVD